MPFEDFQNSDDYKNLTTLQQMQAAGAYYDQKVSNQIPEEYRKQGKEEFIKQKTPDSLRTIIGGAHAFLSNIGNVESEIVAKIQGPEAVKQYEQSPERQQTENLNTEQAHNIDLANKGSGTVNIPYVGEVGMGNVYDMMGQTAPIMGVAGPVGKVAGNLATGWGVPIISKIAPWFARTEVAGAVAGTGQAANAPTVDQSLEQTGSNIQQGAEAAPLIDLGIRGPGLIARGVSKVKGTFGKTGAEAKVGKELNENLSPESKQNLEQYTNTPQNQQEFDLNTTAVTQSPFAFRKASEIRNKVLNLRGKQVNPGQAQSAKNEAVNSKLAGNLQNTNVPNANPSAVQSEAANTVGKEQERINSPLTFKETELQKPQEVASAESTTTTSGKMAKEVYNKVYAEDQAQQAAHAKIDPDSNINIATHPIQDVFHDDVEGFHKNDPILEPIVTDIDEHPRLPVRQLLDYKNTLENYIYDRTVERKNGSTDLNITDKINAAKDLSNTIKDTLGKENTPSAIQGKTVGQAFEEAQTGTKKFYTSLLEDTSGLPARITTNPTTGVVTESHFSPSATGKMYRAARNEAASPNAVEGKRIFDPTKPDQFVSSIRNIGNIKDIEPTVKQNIISFINEASDKPIESFDKVYTKDIDSALRTNGFSKTADDLVALRKSLGAQNQTLESQNALLRMGKERAQADLDASTATKLYSKGNPLTQNQIADIVLKSPESKQSALDLVRKAKDAGASKRGLGQIVLNKLKSDSISDSARSIDNQKIQALNANKFNSLLTEHEDVLRQTLGNKEYEAIQAINDVAMKLEYSETGMTKTAGQVLEPTEHLYKGMAVEAGSKIVKLGPPSAILHPFQALKEASKINYYKALYAAQDPYVAKRLMTAATSNKPGAVENILNGLTKIPISTALTPETIKGTSYKIPETVDEKKQGPQSSNTAISATSAALASAKDNSGFSIGDLNPISSAQASEIKVPENSPISQNVADFKAQDKRDNGALQNAMKRHSVDSKDMMAIINAESSVKKLTGNGYAQITPAAWTQAEQLTGRKLNRKNANDYAEAAVSYFKWTSDQVKKIAGTGDITNVYTAYNAGIGGFKALYTADPSKPAINVVPKNVSENNKAFYFNKDGTPFTVSQTLQKYKEYIHNKQNEYSPTTPSKATELALSQSRVLGPEEPDE